MRPLSAREPMRQSQTTAGNPTIKAMPSAEPHYSQTFLVSSCNCNFQKRRQHLQLPFFLTVFVAQAQNAQTHMHTPQAIWVYECNLVLTLSLLWVSVVCCASEMKAGLSNNSEFNTSTSPLMRVPCVCSRLISAAPVGEEARKEGNVVKISH